MKYANPSRYALLLALIGGISACSTNLGREVTWNYDGSDAVELATTEQFLPVQEQDRHGRLLPYKAEPNPYVKLRGRIDREAVTTYINARRAFGAQKYNFADQLLEDLASQQPELSGSYVMRGDIAASRENFAQAVEHYVSAIRTNHLNFNAYLRLAKVQRMRGHFRHAQNTYAKALELWPDGAEIHLNLGVLYDMYLNEPLQAQAHMEAYQLLSDDNSGRVVAWLEEIRERTGVDTALEVVGPDGESLQLSGSATDEKPQDLAASNSSKE